MHVAFSGIVSGIPNASINIPYRNGAVAGWFDIGSVRPDAVYGDINSPNFVVELKTGNARLQNPQLSNYLNNLPPGTPICEIHEAP